MRVHFQVIEGERRRVQVFEGIVSSDRAPACARPSRSQAVVRRRRRADVPGSLAEDREDRGRRDRRRQPRQALLPPRPRREEGSRSRDPAGPDRRRARPRRSPLRRRRRSPRSSRRRPRSSSLRSRPRSAPRSSCRASRFAGSTEIPVVPDAEVGWHPLTHHFGLTAFGANVFVAAAAQDELVAEHDESASGPGSSTCRRQTEETE